MKFRFLTWMLVLGFIASPVHAKKIVVDVPDDYQEDPSGESSQAEEELSRWSLGIGFSGYSANGQTVVVAMGEIRYLWTLWLESVGGISLHFGSDTYFGLRAAQRVYAPLHPRFRPYAELGMTLADVSDGHSTSLDMGGGVQFSFSERSYVEFGVSYHYRSLFDSSSDNYLTFAGSTGFRF